MKDKTSLKAVLYVVLFIAIYILIQFFFQAICSEVYALFSKQSFKTVVADMQVGQNGILLMIISVLSSITALIVFLTKGWAKLSNTYLASRPWGTILWACLLAIGTILPLEFIYEKINLAMPKHTQALFESIVQYPWGYVALGIFAPIAEEVVFRGAILRTLLSVCSREKHWIAIIISALIFGVAHWNLVQGIHAFIIGLILGWMYYRTHSLVPGIALHWINNTVAFVMYNLMPQMADGKLINFFHGSEKLMHGGLFFSLCVLVPSIYQLAIRMKRADQ